MSASIVVEQMIVIFILIFSGYFMYRKKMVNGDTSKALSNIVINITNPAILILSAFDDGPKESLKDLGIASLAIVSVYIVLIAVSCLIPILLKVDKSSRYAYKMLSIFGNIGFLGIPLVQALIGADALIYVSLCCLVFNVLIYTYGLSSLKKAAGITDDRTSLRTTFGKIINAGTVSAVITVVLYLANLPVPEFIKETFSYAANCTTYLSMIVLGIAVAQMVPKEMFSDMKLYIFIVIRQIIIPIVIGMILSVFISNEKILHTLVIEFAVPAGSMSLMFSKQLGLDARIISKGVILTTLLSIITIPIVTIIL